MAIFDKISGIPADNGFKYQSEAPLDARLVVDNYSNLADLKDEHGAYTGMLVYVKSDKKYYSYDGSVWSEFKGSGGGGNTDVAEKANQIQVNFVDEGVTTTEYAKITASSKEPTGGEKGDIWFKY